MTTKRTIRTGWTDTTTQGLRSYAREFPGFGIVTVWQAEVGYWKACVKRSARHVGEYELRTGPYGLSAPTPARLTQEVDTLLTATHSDGSLFYSFKIERVWHLGDRVAVAVLTATDEPAPPAPEPAPEAAPAALSMRFRMLPDGGFAVVSAKGNAAYAYPTSEHATAAVRKPKVVATIMAREADRAALHCHPFTLTEFNARIAAKLES